MGELVERAAQLRALHTVIGEVAAGRPASAVVRGPAGIGKTTLLAHAALLATRPNVRLLSATAHELEQHLPFGIVVQLLAPAVRDLADDDPLFEGPAKLALPVLRREQQVSAPATELDALQGLQWLVVELAEREPLLLAVDDLHWCDPESLRALLYILRRADGVGVGLLAADRTGKTVGPEHEALLAEIHSVLQLPPLTREGVAEVLAAGYDGSTPDDSFVRACTTATSGNPLFLRELCLALAAAGIGPDNAGAAQVPRLVVPTLAETALRRVKQLPDDALALAQAFAVLGRPASVELAGALGGVELTNAVPLVVGLADLDVLTDSPTPTFTHPLLATALHDSIPAVAKAALHRRAAELLTAERADPEEVAQHLLLTPPRRSRADADTLIAAGHASAQRGAPSSAVLFLRRAMEASADKPPPYDVMAELGALETALADPAGEERLRAVVGSAAEPALRGRAALVLAEHLAFAGRGHELSALLDDQLMTSVRALDRDLHLRLLAASVPGRFLSGTPLPSPAELDIAAVKTIGERDYLASLAVTATTAQGTVDLCQEALFINGPGLPAEFVRSASMFFAVSRLVHCDRLGEAERALQLAEDAARRHGSVFEIGRNHYLRAVVAVRRGEAPAAVAEAEAAFELVGDAGRERWGLAHAAATATLLDGLRMRGQLDDAVALMSGQPQDAPPHVGTLFVLAARARVEAARGRTDAAVELLELLEPMAMQRSVEMMFLRVRPTLAPLLAGRGQHDRALAMVSHALAEARAWGLPRNVAEARLAEGLVVGGDDGLEAIGDALRLFAQTPGRYDEALALIELGAALRRAKRPMDARRPLQQGGELAAQCGAELLVVRSQVELRATGAKPRRVRLSGAAALTASELRVARLAAQGLGNREIAETLFVSRKTVEKHLAGSYAKLGISSRVALAEALATEALATEAVAAEAGQTP